MKIGIVGAGAIGLTFAAALTAAGNDVLVLARRAAVAETLERDGITIERNNPGSELDGTAIERDDTAIERNDLGGATLERDGITIERNAAGSESDGAAIERGDGALERSATGQRGAVPVTTVRRVVVRATIDARAFADRDVVVVAVKAYATAAALAPLRGVLAPHALVASVQNGLGNVEAARAALPGTRVIAGSTTQAAIRIGDSRIRPGNTGTTIFGRDASTVKRDDRFADAPSTDRFAAGPSSEELAAAFGEAGLPARVADDVETVLWTKLVANAAINPVCALAERPNGAVVEDPDLEALARALADEAAAVARAEGAGVGDPWLAVEAAARASAANRNSMLQDLDAGRPTEIEAISGEIVRRAATYGIVAPVTETVLRLVRGRERAAVELRSGGTP